jgi:hypothetical protein
MPEHDRSRYVRPQYRKRTVGPRQSTSALTVKLVLLAVIATLAIGGLLAAEMAGGNDPALGPKAVAQAKKSAAKSRGRNSSSSNGSGSGSGTDPYSQAYGGEDGYYYGSGSGGYSSGSSSGYSSGSSGSSYSAPPVTSSTS